MPTHLEVGGLRRRAEALGGMATVLQKGDPDSGSLMLLTMKSGENPCIWERMPSINEKRVWAKTKSQDSDKKHEFSEYITRRGSLDRDLWILELDIPDAERFIAETPC